jgi:hypothetical protein
LHLRDYLIEINAKMQINNIWKIRTLPHKDIAIMDKMIKCRATTREIKTINSWRVYFKVAWLSEIYIAEGNKIAAQYLVYPTNNFVHQHTMKLSWPYQE